MGYKRKSSSGRSTKRYKRSKKRTYRKKRTYKTKTLVKLGNGLPKASRMRLHYVDNLIVNGNAGVIGYQQFILNGLYDFDYTNVGHQPYYYDQMMALYDHYSVMGTKVTLKVMNAGTFPIIFGGYINDDTTITPSTALNLQEAPQAQWRVIQSGQIAAVTLTFKWSAKKWFEGGRNISLADADLRADAAHNPVEQSVLTCWVQSFDKTNNATAYVSVEGNFIAEFYELKDIANS